MTSVSHAPLLGATRFASGSIPEDSRIQAWESHNQQSLVALRAENMPFNDFGASGLNLNLPELDVARVRCTPHRVSRDEKHISNNPVAGALAYVNLSRPSALVHRGHTYQHNRWEVLVVDGDQHFTREFEHGVDEYVFRLSRELLHQSTENRNLSKPQIFGSHQGPVVRSTIASLLSLASEALKGTERDWDGLQLRASQLFGTLLSSERATQLETARTIVRRKFADPNFGAQELASALGVSTRQLTRIFAPSEIGFSQEVLQVRLNAAQTQLADHAFQSVSIAEIAGRCGFKSPAHFSRSYRAKYGISPLSHRKELLSGA